MHTFGFQQQMMQIVGERAAIRVCKLTIPWHRLVLHELADETRYKILYASASTQPLLRHIVNSEFILFEKHAKHSFVCGGCGFALNLLRINCRLIVGDKFVDAAYVFRLQ